ncbi:hypothetical protein [Lysinibacillus sp. 54212]|uniref:hypothetical protein n=1 Tax=Lysinibacillus sp. 54212 TaxID=3119829 RepID=UPI002FC7445E
MSLPLILIVVVSIVATFGAAIIWVVKQNDFSTKQTIDPKPEQTFQKVNDKQ